jgi:hypothetical protein
MGIISKIRLSFLKKNLLIVLGKIRILQMEVSRLEKIHDEMMIENKERFALDVIRHNGNERTAMNRATSPFTGYLREATEISMKIGGLEKEIEILFDERCDLRLKAVELKGVSQAPSINAEIHKMLA